MPRFDPVIRIGAALFVASAAARPGVPAAETTVVPDLPRLDRSGEIEVPWTEFSITALVLLVVFVGAAMVFFADRVATASAERRRRVPPRSILAGGRR